MSLLSELPNVGKVLENHLMAIGVETPEQLRALGSEEIFALIRLKRDPGACLHMLYGIEGSIENISYKYLSDDVKENLKVYYKSL